MSKRIVASFELARVSLETLGDVNCSCAVKSAKDQKVTWHEYVRARLELKAGLGMQSAPPLLAAAKEDEE